MSWEDVLATAGYRSGGDLLHVPTSGTTAGRPRVVVRTVASWRDSFDPFTGVTGITATDTVLAAGPGSSLFVFARAHAAWLGAQCLTADRWRPALAEQATVAHLTPTMLADLLQGPAHRIRLAVVAGAALSPAVRDDALERGIDVVEYYGAAELSFVGIGRGHLEPFPQVEVEERAGVLWVRSPWTALGYATGQTGPFRQVDGWCTVGDRGRVGASGIHLHGRDGVVTTGGTSVPVADVEAVLRAAPGVRDAVVLGLAHERLGEVLAAVVVAADRATVLDHCRGRLSRQSRPVQWFRADRIPVTAAGKPDVPELRRRIAAGEVSRWT